MNRALALTRFWRSCGRWSRAGGRRDANPLNSCLDEAEQCRDIARGAKATLYQGEPKALTQTMAGVAFTMSSPQGKQP